MNFENLVSALPEKASTTFTDVPYPLIASGKVREIYDAGECFLIIASDRLSAFDVILPDGIPGKGVILTQISLHWFSVCADVIQNHLLDNHEQKLTELLPNRPDLWLRTMAVKKLSPLPIEAIVRNYIAGGGWKDYQENGSLYGQSVPAGLKLASQLPQPYFTPTTKAQSGHDEPISLADTEELLGSELFHQVQTASFALFNEGSKVAAASQLILADTKFEFGTDQDGQLYIIDEILTPDSSRYWPAEGHTPGKVPHAFDKQFVRDYLETLDWDKTAPGPKLPQEVIETTTQRYLETAKALLK